MAPRRKTSRKQEGDETLVESLEAEIRAIEREIKMARKRFEKTIREVKLSVVCYKADLGPELLRSKLYEVMCRENEALCINHADRYLDIVTHTEKYNTDMVPGIVALQDAMNQSTDLNDNQQLCKKTRNRTDGVSQPTNEKITKYLKENETVGNDVNKVNNTERSNDNESEKMRLSDDSGSTVNDVVNPQLNTDEDFNRNHPFNEARNIDSLTEKENQSQVIDTCGYDAGEKAKVVLDETDVYRGYVSENETRSAPETKMPNFLRESITDPLDQIISSNTKNQLDDGKSSLLTLEPNSQHTDFIFQACIEQNKHLLTSAGSFTSKNTTKTGDKIPKWQEKYDDYNRGKNLYEEMNENCIEIVKNPVRENIERAKKVLGDRMNFNAHTEHVVARIQEHINEVKVMNTKEKADRVERVRKDINWKENEIMSEYANSDKTDILKTPILFKTQNSIPRTVQKSSSVPSKTLGKLNTASDKSQTISSNTKGNVLRASKLGAPVENIAQRLSDRRNSDGVCRNTQRLTENGGLASSRTSTPRKQDQRCHSEQRAGSRSKIPKFLYMSPVSKLNKPAGTVSTTRLINHTNKATTHVRNTSEPSWTSRVLSNTKGKQVTSVTKKPTDVIVPQSGVRLRDNNPIFKKNLNKKENVHAFTSGQTMKTGPKPNGIPKTGKALENRWKKSAIIIGQVTKSNAINPEHSQSQNITKVSTHDKDLPTAFEGDLPTVPDVLRSDDDFISEKSRSPVLSISSKSGSPKLPHKTNVILSPNISNKIGTIDNAGGSFNETQHSSYENINSLEIDDPKQMEINAKPVTLPVELYTFKENITDIKQNKPIDFIKRNKERIKKMASKSRKKKSKSKDTGAFKIFKNSIVIDSRYLMIVNKILEENRKCLSCRRERDQFKNKRSSMMCKDPLNQCKGIIPDQNIFVKFSNFKQLQNVISQSTEEIDYTLNSTGNDNVNKSRTPKSANLSVEKSKKFHDDPCTSSADDNSMFGIGNSRNMVKDNIPMNVSCKELTKIDSNKVTNIHAGACKTAYRNGRNSIEIIGTKPNKSSSSSGSSLLGNNTRITGKTNGTTFEDMITARCGSSKESLAKSFTSKCRISQKGNSINETRTSQDEHAKNGSRSETSRKKIGETSIKNKNEVSKRKVVSNTNSGISQNSKTGSSKQSSCDELEFLLNKSDRSVNLSKQLNLGCCEDKIMSIETIESDASTKRVLKVSPIDEQQKVQSIDKQSNGTIELDKHPLNSKNEISNNVVTTNTVFQSKSKNEISTNTVTTNTVFQSKSKNEISTNTVTTKTLFQSKSKNSTKSISSTTFDRNSVDILKISAPTGMDTVNEYLTDGDENTFGDYKPRLLKTDEVGDMDSALKPPDKIRDSIETLENFENVVVTADSLKAKQVSCEVKSIEVQNLSLKTSPRKCDKPMDTSHKSIEKINMVPNVKIEPEIFNIDTTGDTTEDTSVIFVSVEVNYGDNLESIARIVDRVQPVHGISTGNHSVEIINTDVAIKEEVEPDDLSFVSCTNDDSVGEISVQILTSGLIDNGLLNSRDLPSKPIILEAIKSEPADVSDLESSDVLDDAGLPKSSQKSVSVEYLESKMTNPLFDPISRPITLVPIENLLSSRYNKLTDIPNETAGHSMLELENEKIQLEIIEPEHHVTVKSEKIIMSNIKNGSFNDLHTNEPNLANLNLGVSIVKYERTEQIVPELPGISVPDNIDSLKANTPSISEFELSLDHAFTSTKQNISTQTNDSFTLSFRAKGSAMKKPPRGTPTTKTPKTGFNKSTRTIGKTPKAQEINTSGKPLKTPVATPRIVLRAPKTPTPTPKQTPKRPKPRQLVSSTPLPLGNRSLRSQTIKEEML